MEASSVITDPAWIAKAQEGKPLNPLLSLTLDFTWRLLIAVFVVAANAEYGGGLDAEGEVETVHVESPVAAQAQTEEPTKEAFPPEDEQARPAEE